MNKTILLLFTMSSLALVSCHKGDDGYIQTVEGRIGAKDAGIFLPHEHILVDFIGAEAITPERWDNDEVIGRVWPFLDEAKKQGCKTFVDCTPAFLGRDPRLLKKLSQLSELNILTNTGLYGAVNHKYLPAYAFEEDADRIASRWIEEWKNGIEGTEVRPGFIKISVDFDSSTTIQRKLVHAAAICHKQTGLTIAAHAGPAARANEIVNILGEEGVAPEALIWVHAQVEKELLKMTDLAKRGAWISLDGITARDVERYIIILDTLKHARMLEHILLSHDAGWYSPGEEKGGDFTPYTALFVSLIPKLREHGYTDEEIGQLVKTNPAHAYTIRKRLVSE